MRFAAIRYIYGPSRATFEKHRHSPLIYESTAAPYHSGNGDFAFSIVDEHCKNPRVALCCAVVLAGYRDIGFLYCSG